MPPEIIPIIEEPALTATNTETSLVIADVHLGIEWDLYRSGINLPSRMKDRLDRILSYIQSVSPDRVVLLGDIKHNVPQVSWQEKDEIPCFLETLAEHAHVDILPGNHDGGIEFLFSGQKDIKVHSAKGAVLDGIGYFHGHTWPAPELLAASHVITAHNHPTVRFTDSLGYSTVEPAWIRTKFRAEVLKERFGNLDFENKNGIPLIVFNSMSLERTNHVKVSLNISGKNFRNFELIDHSGKKTASQILNCERDNKGNISQVEIVFLAEKAQTKHEVIVNNQVVCRGEITWQKKKEVL